MTLKNRYSASTFRPKGLLFFATTLLLASTISVKAQSTTGVQVADEVTAEKELIQQIETIQRECLRAYPPELLSRMTGGVSQIPQKVDSDPRQQQQFLNTELEVEKGLFYPIELGEMSAALKQVLEPGDTFLDLGSGDGRVLFLANILGAHATGMEYDPEMVDISRRAAQALDSLVNAERLSILQGDFFLQRWSGYDVIFYFDLSSSEQDRVRAKLAEEIEPGALLIVGYEQAPFPGFELVQEMGRSMRVYRRSQQPR